MFVQKQERLAMDPLSDSILAVLLPFRVLFSTPSWNKALTLTLGALLCTGKRTVCSALRAMGLSDESNFTNYHQILNRAKWSPLQAANILLLMLLTLIGTEPIVLDIDETLERRKGKRIRAKGYYRDAVRSSKSQLVKASGLKWLVMSLSVKIPFIPRVLALPFLTVLEYSKKDDEQRKRRHKTTIMWTSQMIAKVRKWVGKARSIILVGDGGFASGQLAIDCIRYAITLVTHLKMNAALFDFPPDKVPGMRGRPPKKGHRLFNFKQMLSIKELVWKEVEVIAYGGEKRKVRYVSNTSMWGADGSTPIPIRWVLITDPTGRLDPMPLMSTDPTLSPERIIELYIARWNLEVTFEETREHLGVETQRQWSDKAILRTTPVLMGLYSLVCLMAVRLGQHQLLHMCTTAWYEKTHITFSDMLRAVRVEIWKKHLFSGMLKTTPSEENITPKMYEFAAKIVKRLLQAA